MIEVKGISKSYWQSKREIQVLKKLSFSVASGEKVAIVGPSGSGKSTLLSLLSGLDRPDSGAIQVDGTTINTLSEKDLAAFRGQRIGIVFQQFHLLASLSALENTRLPLDLQRLRKSETEANRLLEMVGLGDRTSHYPHQLSGGEMQRVAIARALITKPAILLADEPTGNLDQNTGDQVMAKLLEIAALNKQTVLLVTHNSRLAQLCDRILQLSNGTLEKQ